MKKDLSEKLIRFTEKASPVVSVIIPIYFIILILYDFLLVNYNEIINDYISIIIVCLAGYFGMWLILWIQIKNPLCSERYFFFRERG